MRRLLLAAAALLGLACLSATAQTVTQPGGSGCTANCTFTGITTAPSFTVTGTTVPSGYGINLQSATALGLFAAGTETNAISAGSFGLLNAGVPNNNLGPQYVVFNAVNQQAQFGITGTTYGTAPFSASQAYAWSPQVGGILIGTGGAAPITFATTSVAVATIDATGHLRLSGSAVPTIASGACGTGTNGTISGSDQSGQITIGAAATSACAVSFGSAFTAAPRACVFAAASAGSAATTVLPFISAISTGGFTLSGTLLANTAWYYSCI